MLIHTESNTVFENRKQAVKCMGQFIYRRELSRNHFIFINSREGEKKATANK